MRKFTCAAVGSLMLAGCGGGGEDFSVELHRTPERVLASLSAIDLAEARQALPDLDIRKSQPGSNELVFTIASKGSDGKEAGQSVIYLRLEPVRDGKGTVIHATVDVPATRVMMGKANMVLSEAKVEAALKKLLERSGQHPAHGLAGGRTSGEMRDLLVAVAVDSNVAMQSRINAIKRGESSLPDRLAMTDEPDLGDEQSSDEQRSGDQRDGDQRDGETAFAAPEIGDAGDRSGASAERP